MQTKSKEQLIEELFKIREAISEQGFFLQQLASMVRDFCRTPEDVEEGLSELYEQYDIEIAGDTQRVVDTMLSWLDAFEQLEEYIVSDELEAEARTGILNANSRYHTYVDIADR